jgi:hypothetical protein
MSPHVALRDILRRRTSRSLCGQSGRGIIASSLWVSITPNWQEFFCQPALSLAAPIVRRDDRRRSDLAAAERQPADGRAFAFVVEIERALCQGVPQLGATIIEARPTGPALDLCAALRAHGHDGQFSSRRGSGGKSIAAPLSPPFSLANLNGSPLFAEHCAAWWSCQQAQLIARTERQRTADCS